MVHQPLRRTCLGALLLALGGALLAPAASAQSAFPTKPITVIVPFPAGGSTDRHLRIVAQDASKYLGQTVIIENRPGAGGTLGPATTVSYTHLRAHET